MGLFADEFSKGVGIGSQIVRMMRDAKAAAHDEEFLQMALQKSQLELQHLNVSNQMDTMQMDEFKQNQPIRQQQAQLGLQSQQQGLQNQQQQGVLMGDQHQENQNDMAQKAIMFPMQQAMLGKNMQLTDSQIERSKNQIAMEKATQGSDIAFQLAKNKAGVTTFEREQERADNEKNAQRALTPWAKKVLIDQGVDPKAADFNGNFFAVQMLGNLDEQKSQIEYRKAAVGNMKSLAGARITDQELAKQRLADRQIFQMASNPKMVAYGLMSNDPTIQGAAMTFDQMKEQLPEGATAEEQQAFYMRAAAMNDDPDVRKKFADLAQTVGQMIRPTTSAKVPGEELPGLPGFKTAPTDATTEQLRKINEKPAKDLATLPVPKGQGKSSVKQGTGPVGPVKKSTFADVRDVAAALKDGRMATMAKNGQLVAGQTIKTQDGQEILIDGEMLRKLRKGE